MLGFDPLVLAAPWSLVLMLVSAFFLALGTVLMRPLRGLSAFSMQAWTAAIGVVPLLAASVLLEPGAFAAAAGAGTLAWGGVVYSAVVASLLGHGLYYLLVQRHPIAQLTPWLLLTPVVAVGLGIAFWGDRPGIRLYVGGAMVLGGVLLIALRAMARARAVPPAREI